MKKLWRRKNCIGNNDCCKTEDEGKILQKGIEKYGCRNVDKGRINRENAVTFMGIK